MRHVTSGREEERGQRSILSNVFKANFILIKFIIAKLIERY